MTQTKTIKEYKTEELQQILIGTKATILDFTERLQIENQNRQVIEKELVERQKEEENKSVKDLDEEVIDMVAGNKTKKTK